MARTIEIIISAKDKASPALEKTGSALGGLGSALGGVATVAGGMLAADVIGGLARAVAGLGKTALDSVGQFQQLEISVEGLLTQSLMYQEVNAQRQETISLTEEEEEKLASLTAKLETHNAKMKEQEQRVWEMTNLWTEEGLATETAKAKLAEMQLQAEQMGAEIAELTAKQGGLATVTERSWQQTMDFAQAQGLAREQADELLKKITALALTSPFETEQVEAMAQIGLAARLSAEQTADFTEAFLDFAAVAGIPRTELEFAAEQFLQLRKIGKLTTIDLRQLSRLGIDVGRILGVEMGMSVEQFNEQVEQSPELMDELIESFIHFSGTVAEGASERMGLTVSAMMGNVRDIITIGSRTLFQPIIEEVAPFAAQLMTTVADFITGPRLAEIGQQMADQFSTFFENITTRAGELFAAFQEGGARGLLLELGISETTLDIIGRVQQGIGDLIAYVKDLLAAFGEGGLAGVGQKLAADLESAWPDIQAQLASWGVQFWDWLTQTALPLAGEKLAQIGAVIRENWPAISAQLDEWGQMFWDWINKVAIPNASAKLNQIMDVIVAWSEDPVTSAKLEAMGEIIGKALVDGIGALIAGGYLTTKMALAFQGVPASLAEATANMGTSIATGIINGITEKLNIDLGAGIGSALEFIGVENATELGRKLAAGLAAGFQEGLQTAMSLINPVAFLRGQIGNVQEGVTGFQEAGGFGALGDLSSLFGFGDEQGAIQTTNMANQIGDGLNAALPNAIIERGVGANTLKGIGDDMDADEEGKKKLAGVVTNGLLQYIGEDVDGVGQALIAFLTSSVRQQLGLASGEVRP